MASKTKDKFADLLSEREAEAVAKVEKARTALVAERERLPDFDRTVEATESAIEELEAEIRRGDTSITGMALLEARADHEVAAMRLAGSERRMKRLAELLSKSNTDKAVAEIVRDVLAQRVVPGARTYATFHTGGFTKDSTKPNSLPALVVSQLDGGMGNDGVGEGRVRIVWHRSPLHTRISADQLRAALEAAGFTIDPTFGLNDGLTLWSSDDADTAEVQLRNVSDETPVVTSPLASAEGWDESLALEINNQDVEAQGVGAQVVSAEVDDNGVRTTVVRLSVGVRQSNHADDINLIQTVKGKVEASVNKTRKGAGRCVQTKVERVSSEAGEGRSTRSALVGGQHVYAAEYVYKARAA